MTDTSQMPSFAEPFFLALGADIEATPVMVPADLEKAGPSIQRAAEKYGGHVTA